MATTNSIAPFPDDIDREAFGHWLSGFADGEASFLLRTMFTNGKHQPFATFRIGLRADDGPALQLIQSFLGCGLLIFNSNVRSKIPNAKPVMIFCVQDRPSLANIIIPHFERYKLRAKKAGDFAVWKEGVALMLKVMQRKLTYRRCGQRHQGTFPKWTVEEREHFQSLVTALSRQRTYSETTTTTITPIIRTVIEPTLFDDFRG